MAFCRCRAQRDQLTTCCHVVAPLWAPTKLGRLDQRRISICICRKSPARRAGRHFLALAKASNSLGRPPDARALGHPRRPLVEEAAAIIHKPSGRTSAARLCGLEGGLFAPLQLQSGLSRLPLLLLLLIPTSISIPIPIPISFPILIPIPIFNSRGAQWPTIDSAGANAIITTGRRPFGRPSASRCGPWAWRALIAARLDAGRP